MKSTLFKKVLREEFIEVNKSVFETIQCLCDQSGLSYDKTYDDLPLFFKCTKKGKISIVNNAGYTGRFRLNMLQIYHVYGKVIEQNKKTYVKITSVYKRTDTFLRAFFIALSVIYVVMFGLALCLSGEFKNIFAPVLLSFIFAMIITPILSTNARIKSKSENISLMENEIKRRVENIKYWDD